MKCRHCNSSLEYVFADLGTSPPSNSYLRDDQLNKLELFYPLRVKVCESCWFVNRRFYKSRGIFQMITHTLVLFPRPGFIHAKEYVQK